MSNQASLIVALRAKADGTIAQLRRDALTTPLPTHIIDTCNCVDTGQWETGIEPKDEKWVIVEQYPDRESAIIGHNKWVESIKSNPKQDLKNVLEYGF